MFRDKTSFYGAFYSTRKSSLISYNQYQETSSQKLEQSGLHMTDNGQEGFSFW